MNECLSHDCCWNLGNGNTDIHYCGGSSRGRRKERSENDVRFVDGVGVGVAGAMGGKAKGGTEGESGGRQEE